MPYLSASRLAVALVLALPLGCTPVANDEPDGDTTGNTGTGDDGSGDDGSGDDGSGTADTGGPDTGDTGTDDGPTPVDLVPVTINTQVLLPTNYGKQIYNLFSATFTAGSAMGRMRVWARFCEDEACEEPVALVQGTIEDADEDGYYVFSTASASGTGFDHLVTFDEAPVGTWTMQLIGDTQASALMNKGECSSLDDCPGDVDVVQMEGTSVEPNNEGGHSFNPPMATMEITIDGEGAVVDVPDVVFLGHTVFSGEEIHTPPPSDPGRLFAAVSSEDDDYRNLMVFLDLDDATGAPADDTYTLQREGGDFLGDVCGVISGGGSRWAIGVDNDGAHVFELDEAGQQVSDVPVASVPPDGDNYPWPCRGVYLNSGNSEHLYLVQYRGAGSLPNSTPHVLYDVDLNAGTIATPLDSASSMDMAFRSVVVGSSGSLIGMDQSWSVSAGNASTPFIRLFSIPLDGDGVPTGIGPGVVTDLTSDAQCDSTANWPSSMRVVSVGGTDRLLVGHDDGIAVYDMSNLMQIDNLDLRDWGTLITNMVPSQDGTQLYAMPNCKSITAEDFELPQGAGTEKSDKNLVAVLDITGSDLAVADTDLDINGDGTNDNGIDLDYYRIKSYIRTFNSTLPIPPVVYTAPQLAVGESMLFVRGSGIQGDGGSTISSSGMGQPQDFAMFDLSTGDGVVMNDYMPFFDGLSSMAGTGAAIWGYDVWPGQESSVGWIEYIPAN